MPIGIKNLNSNRIIQNLNVQIKGIEGRTKSGLIHAGQALEQESRARTPIDTAALINSHYVSLSSNNIVEVGVNTPYAVPVHEILEYRHPIGQAKYLEDAITASSNRILTIIRSHAKL